MKEKKEFDDSIEQILAVTKTSASIAIAESKALGLPITYLKDGKIIREYADGKIEILKTIETSENTTTYKKGQVVHVKKQNK